MGRLSRGSYFVAAWVWERRSVKRPVILHKARDCGGLAGAKATFGISRRQALDALAARLARPCKRRGGIPARDRLGCGNQGRPCNVSGPTISERRRGLGRVESAPCNHGGGGS